MKNCRRLYVFKPLILVILDSISRSLLRLVDQLNLKDVGSIKRKEIKSIGPFAFICSSSNHKYHTLIFSFINEKIRVLEKLEKNSLKGVFHHIRKLYNIDFRELKFAVDDYGIITYLNRDF